MATGRWNRELRARRAAVAAEAGTVYHVAVAANPFQRWDGGYRLNWSLSR